MTPGDMTDEQLVAAIGGGLHREDESAVALVLPRDDEMLQLRTRTRAWPGGTRHTATERLIIKPDRTPLFR